MIKVKGEDKFKASNMIKSTNILRLEQGGGKIWKGRAATKRSNQ